MNTHPTIWMMKGTVQAGPATGYPEQRYTVIVFVRANDEALAVNNARQQLASAGWADDQFDQITALAVPAAKIAMPQAREMVERAETHGFGLVVFHDTAPGIH